MPALQPPQAGAPQPQQLPPGFLPAQLAVLRAQIVAYKLIKTAAKEGKKLALADLGDIQPPPLGQPQPAASPQQQQRQAVPAPAPAVVQPARPAPAAAGPPPMTSAAALGAFAAAAATNPGGAMPGGYPGMMPLPPGVAAQQQAQARGAPKQQSARNQGQGPIFTLTQAPKGGHFPTPPVQPGFLRGQQLRYDVQGLLQVRWGRQEGGTVVRPVRAARAGAAAPLAALTGLTSKATPASKSTSQPALCLCLASSAAGVPEAAGAAAGGAPRAGGGGGQGGARARRRRHARLPVPLPADAHRPRAAGPAAPQAV